MKTSRFYENRVLPRIINAALRLAVSRLAASRLTAARVPVQRTGLDGQALPFADNSFDTALSTWTLCTIPDVAAALREVRQVLKPGGAFHFSSMDWRLTSGFESGNDAWIRLRSASLAGVTSRVQSWSW